MTNTEIVLDTFRAMGGSTQHNKALIFAISQRHKIAENLALQLVQQAIQDSVLTIDSIGEVRVSADIGGSAITSGGTPPTVT